MAHVVLCCAVHRPACLLAVALLQGGLFSIASRNNGRCVWVLRGVCACSYSISAAADTYLFMKTAASPGCLRFLAHWQQMHARLFAPGIALVCLCMRLVHIRLWVYTHSTTR